MLKRCFPIFVCLLVFSFSVAWSDETDSSPKELDKYLALKDDSFRWEVDETIDENLILLELTSQTWHDIPWKHALLLALPQKPVAEGHAVLYIGGKRIGSKPGEGDHILARTLAGATGMPVAMLFQVPNQPLLGNYVEDALIGETLLKALETEDTTWPLLFPMAKSAIRAMDAVQQFLEKEKNTKIDNFIVTGASKRGWTTWLTAASKDPRVKAIAPIVIDTLNLQKQMKYQVETWGAFSPSIHDYTDRNLVETDHSDFSEFKKSMWTMIDPYSYRSRYTMPKLLVHGTNDPYWTVDATRNYWDDLTDVKYILTLPNAGHGLDGQQFKAVQTIAVFARHAALDGVWPELSWTLEEKDANYVVNVKTDLPYKKVRLWTASSETKDFRKAVWRPKTIASGTDGAIEIAKPASGHVAFYIELESSEYGLSYSLTTQVWRY